MKTISITARFGVVLFALISLALVAQGVNPLYVVAASIGGMVGGLGTLAALVLLLNAQKTGEYVITRAVAKLSAAIQTK